MEQVYLPGAPLAFDHVHADRSGDLSDAGPWSCTRRVGLFSAARPVGADAVHRALDVRPALCGAGAAGDMTDKAPKLLSGGNPQIAKGDGDAPVQAYIAAMPGWKRAAGERLDALIENSVPGVQKAVRSEEHTSELQSIMRTSYAVFCWKKKKTKKS